ncbi:MAG: hypothetical protein VX642_01450 [Bdellovibrionota bacterium]|nr:hypothetical protein [Bdellovibrionota bacterium]
MIHTLNKLLLCLVFVVTHSNLAMANSTRGHGASPKLKDKFVIVERIYTDVFDTIKYGLKDPETLAYLNEFLNENTRENSQSFETEKILNFLEKIIISKEKIDKDFFSFMEKRSSTDKEIYFDNPTYSLIASKKNSDFYSIKICLDDYVIQNKAFCEEIAQSNEDQLKGIIPSLALIKESKFLQKILVEHVESSKTGEYILAGLTLGLTGAVIGLSVTLLIAMIFNPASLAFIAIASVTIATFAGISYAVSLINSLSEDSIRNAREMQLNLDQKIDDTILRLNQEAFEQNAVDEETGEAPLLP